MFSKRTCTLNPEPAIVRPKKRYDVFSKPLKEAADPAIGLNLIKRKVSLGTSMYSGKGKQRVNARSWC